VSLGTCRLERLAESECLQAELHRPLLEIVLLHGFRTRKQRALVVAPVAQQCRAWRHLAGKNFSDLRFQIGIFC
jgi:hypothetical protein